MNLDKDTLHGLSKFVTKFVVLTAPGLVINEFVFHKGIYSGGIVNIYDFLLLIIWSVFYSLPYYACLILTIAWYEIKTKEELEKAVNDPELFETSIPLLFMLVVINFFAYKIMLFLNWMNSLVKYGISQQYTLLIVSVMITCAVCFPISKLYFYLLDKFISRIRIALIKRISRPIEKQK